MNTIVWVLVVQTYAGNWVPTIEFKTQEKCEVAATNLEKVKTSIRTPFCLKVEK